MVFHGDTPTFSNIGWATSGGLRIAVVKCDRQRPAKNSGLVNRTVMIDGKHWYCTGLDRDSKGDTILPGERIYLWVRPV
jgi:hypothetical protein